MEDYSVHLIRARELMKFAEELAAQQKWDKAAAIMGRAHAEVDACGLALTRLELDSTKEAT